MSRLSAIKEKLWRFRELFIAAFLTCFLMGIYVCIIIGSLQGFFIPVEQIKEITPKLAARINNVIKWTWFLSMLLSLILSPFAIYFALTNERLVLPIRLLAASENLSKFVYCIWYLISNFCFLPTKIIRCGARLAYELRYISVWNIQMKIFMDFAQYTQMMISLSRFFAVSFDGIYFRYTLRLPLLQMAFPYLLRIAFEVIISFHDPYTLTISSFPMITQYYLLYVPWFIMSSLDLLTALRLRKMLINSALVLFDAIVINSSQYVVQSFIGPEIRGVIFDYGLPFLEAFMFNPFSNVVTIFCFLKRKEKIQEAMTTESYLSRSSRSNNSRNRAVN